MMVDDYDGGDDDAAAGEDGNGNNNNNNKWEYGSDEWGFVFYFVSEIIFLTVFLVFLCPFYFQP